MSCVYLSILSTTNYLDDSKDSECKVTFTFRLIHAISSGCVRGFTFGLMCFVYVVCFFFPDLVFSVLSSELFGVSGICVLLIGI